MTRKRFLSASVKTGEEYVILRGAEAHHAGTVLRLERGDAVEAGDGRGRVWHGIVSDVGGDEVRIQLIEEIRVENESPVDAMLALSFARADRMELALRQATELGAGRFVAFRAARSQYGLTGEQAGKRLERWRRIADQALCQCGRTMAPRIAILENTREFLESVRQWEIEDGTSLKMVAFEGPGCGSVLSLRRSFPVCRRALAAVGPEGGWERGEVDQFIEAGFHPVHLGPRILRLETAATAFLTTIQLLWGDLGDILSEGIKP